MYKPLSQGQKILYDELLQNGFIFNNMEFELNQFSGCRQGKHPSTYYSNIFQSVSFTSNIPKVSMNIKEISWNSYPLIKQIENAIKSTEHSVCLHGYFQSDWNWKEYFLLWDYRDDITLSE